MTQFAPTWRGRGICHVASKISGLFSVALNHINTFQYHHLGEDIGASEARRAAADLQLLVEQVLANPIPDSPVYTFIPKLAQPKLSEAEFEALVSKSIANEAAFSELMISGESALRESDFSRAVDAFEAALIMKPGDVYLTQQLALSSYKSKRPSEIAALVQALKIIESLDPEKSNDPETLGITGAIHKRLWNITADVAELDLAILYYGRGFDIRRDYYNGENFALCMDIRGSLDLPEAEKNFYFVSARKAREQIVATLIDVIRSGQYDERSDKRWIDASMANALFALGNSNEAEVYEKRFINHFGLAEWEIETYFAGKATLGSYLVTASLKNSKRRTAPKRRSSPKA